MKTRILKIIFAVVLMSSLLLTLNADVLIVADEIPAMKTFSEFVKTNADIKCKIVTQSEMPANLDNFSSIIVYIHRNLNESVEKALIDYTLKGGKLIPLHHSISSGKGKNKYWFEFLGVSLPQGDVDNGGYKWIEGVEYDVVNLAEGHFITSNKIKYNDKISFKVNDGEKELPGFHLADSEVYLNHRLIGNQTLLLGFKYTDKKSGKTYMQSHCGWLKKAEKGLIIYLMPGHSVKEFQNPIYSQIVLNAILFKP
ncbi:MAG TPA: ThuA domain-containing protein [Verrucomicrobiota bacterium]|nr:ThuA domain-containing protein [Verrucomicrobiota bacterium]